MKRKILFVVMIMALLACVLAISVSAATVLIDEVYYDLDDSTMQATVSSNNQKNCKKSVVVIPEKVKYNDNEYDVTAIALKAFGSGNTNGGNSYVTSVTVPNSVTTIGEYAFGNCPNIESAYVYSTVVGDRMFQDCAKLTTLVLENTVSMGMNSFARTGITSVILPSTLTTLSTYSFKGCTSLEKVVLLGSTLGASMFDGCTSLDIFVVTTNYTVYGASCFGTVPNGMMFVTYYTGSDYQRVLDLGSGTGSTARFSRAKNAEYVGYGNELYTATTKTHTIVYNANLCEVAFGGVHLEDGNPCVINCTRCGVSGVAQANPVHSESASIVYENGFNNAGEKIIGCSNAGCEYRSTEPVNAIFNCLGYSTRNGDTGIATGFSVDYDALEAYEALSGADVKFGIVVFNPTYIGETFFDANGNINASKGAIQIELEEGYSTFNMYVAGFDLSKEAYQLLELVFAGYAYTKNDKSDIALFQKDYTVGTETAPNYSPMQSKVTKADGVLYTVKLQTVTTPIVVTTDKNGLKEF